MKNISFFLLIIIISTLSCSVIAPGFNEGNVEYTIVFSAKNMTGDTMIVIDELDTNTIPDKRTYLHTDTFRLIQNDDDSTTMLEVTKYYLTTTIYFYNLNGSLIDTCLIEPTAKVGEKISSIKFDKLEVIIDAE